MTDAQVLPGESAAAYIKRMHSVRQPDGKPASPTCNCPVAYSRCRWAVRYDEAIGYRDRGHGGWGWSRPEGEVQNG